MERPHRVLAALVAPTGSLALGISQDGIVGPRETISTPSARQLAEALYRQAISIVRFAEGIEQQELEVFLGLLPRLSREEPRAPLAEELAARGVRHIAVEAVDFSHLVGTTSLEETAPRERRADSLWTQLLQSLLQLREAGGADGPGATAVEQAGLEEVVALIHRLLAEGGAAAGERPVRLAAQLAGTAARHLAAAPEAARASTVRHIAELVAALPSPLREAVLDAAMKELLAQPREAAELATLEASLTAAELVGSLRRLRAERVAFSPRAAALVESLLRTSAAARSGDDAAALDADPEVLAQRLRAALGDDDHDRVADWQLHDRMVLELPRRRQPAAERPPELDERLAGLGEERQLAQLARTLLELLRRPLFDAEATAAIAGRLDETFRALLAGGRIAEAIDVVEALSDPSTAARPTPALGQVADRCLERLREPSTPAAIIDAIALVPEESKYLLHRLIQLLGPGVLRQLVLAMGEESDLGRRRHAFNLLAALGPAVGAEAAALLGEPRWYIRRNAFALLRQVGERLPHAAVAAGLADPDARVRLEAARCLALAQPPASSALLERALHDAEPKVAEAAATLIGTARLAAGYQPLLALLGRADPLARTSTLRVKALQALGELGDPAALPELQRYFRTFLRVVSLEECRAAYASLARYPAAARRPLLEKGRRSSDSEIRNLCERLLALPGGT